MDVLKITVFISLLLAVAGLVLYVSRVKQGDLEHGDRLSLLPLEDHEQTAEVNPKSSSDGVKTL